MRELHFQHQLSSGAHADATKSVKCFHSYINPAHFILGNSPGWGGVLKPKDETLSVIEKLGSLLLSGGKSD